MIKGAKKKKKNHVQRNNNSEDSKVIYHPNDSRQPLDSREFEMFIQSLVKGNNRNLCLKTRKIKETECRTTTGKVPRYNQLFIIMTLNNHTRLIFSQKQNKNNIQQNRKV